MENLILTLHVIVCILLIILVLLQSGKEGMGVIFGGGSSSLFGSAGAGGILVKLTSFIALIFVATCLSYNVLSSNKTEKDSIIINMPVEDPANPAASSADPSAPAPQGNATTAP